MQISDITQGKAVQIVAARGVRTMEFSTNVIETDGLTIKIEPIYLDNKLIGFDNDSIILSMYVVSDEDNRVYVYTGVKIRSYKVSDGTVYQTVECRNAEGRVTNRRGAHRVWIGVTGSLMVGDSKHERPVTIKDISATGIAFTCDDMTDVTMGMPITLSFTDEENHKSFRLMATVVRSDNSGYKRMIYGCKFKEESNIISQYVNEKQRQNLKATRTIDPKRRGYATR